MHTKIDKQDVAELKNWFQSYVAGYQHADSGSQRNIKLKIDHTERVCKNSLEIGKTLELTDDELRLAEIIALFHDIGRFEQYARYQTFVDRKSEDHAMLGVTILKQHGVLNNLDSAVTSLVIRAINYHNRAALPQHETETCLFFTKLLRDADKLDIWRVVTDYYHQKNGRRNGALELDLPDSPGFSEGVYQDLINKSIVDIKNVKNLNDFKLLQIGWVFDINFTATYRCIKAKRYVELIGDVLPRSHRIQNILKVIQGYLDNHCKEAAE